MERMDDGVGTELEATLLSSDLQWIYVQRQASTWAEFQFGIGDRSIWLNGQLNIDVQVYEDPDELYGCYG
jgi:hypothetical protein